MSLADELRSIQRQSQRRTLSEDAVYAEILAQLYAKIINQIKAAASRQSSSIIQGEWVFPTGIGYYPNSYVADVACRTSPFYYFMPDDASDSYLRLPEPVRLNQKNSLISASYSVDLTVAGKRYAADLQRLARKDGIQLNFYPALCGLGGIAKRQVLQSFGAYVKSPPGGVNHAILVARYTVRL